MEGKPGGFALARHYFAPFIDQKPGERLVQMDRRLQREMRDKRQPTAIDRLIRIARRLDRHARDPAAPPHDGHATLRNASLVASGLLPSPRGRKSMSSGSRTGSSSSGTGTTPHFGQWIMGMGAPQ
jgi:hypothetical protein